MQPVIRESTRFYVTQSNYDELVSNPKADFVIKCEPNNGNHPKGTYRIPNKIARQFVESKMDGLNWKKNKGFNAGYVPNELEEYFKP
jgi:hypothetical protein